MSNDPYTAQTRHLLGIVARNARQRLAGEDATQLFVTRQDISDSLDVLYYVQQHHPELLDSEARNPARQPGLPASCQWTKLPAGGWQVCCNDREIWWNSTPDFCHRCGKPVLQFSEPPSAQPNTMAT